MLLSSLRIGFLPLRIEIVLSLDPSSRVSKEVQVNFIIVSFKVLSLIRIIEEAIEIDGEYSYPQQLHVLSDHCI